jgi:Uma2 family endonuclease
MVAEPKLTRRRFTVDQYHRMIKAGILREGERVELIEGEIVEMAAVGNRHIALLMDLDELFQVRLAGRARVSVQSPVRLSKSSEPEPDVAILRDRPDRYRHGPPLAEDAYLLTEVFDTTTTLAYDRGIKLRLYALAGVPEYWIFDLKRNRLLVFRELEGAAYRRSEELTGGAVAPVAFPDVTVDLDDLFA